MRNVEKLWLTSLLRRNPFLVFASFLVALFATLILSAPPAYAADATWEGGSVIYNGDTYQGPRQASGGSPPGIPDGATYYEYLNDGTARVVYFEGDPTVSDSARTAVYSVSDSGYTQTNRGTSITIDRQADVDADNSSEDEKITSCVVSGIGYIICPMIQFLAEATDAVFEYIENFLQVEPIIAGQDSTLYRAWTIARDIANVAFIVVFLIVIYSHLTSVGLNNYDLKRVIPRMLVAAVAVNLSFYIAAFFVDVSNILGVSLNNLFIGIVNDVGQGAERNALTSTSWSEFAVYLLSGGTILAGAAFQGTMAALSFGSGLLYLFVIILVPIAIIVVVTVSVLAARLAIITVLVVLAPLAFVAYVLPGTKQWFDKWQDLFSTMLMMYPLFAILFGGSHLASYLIAQNASRWETLLIALFVQAVPLVITPFLIRFSGKLLGTFAGMVNNPAKGLGDRAKVYAKDRADEVKEKRLASGGFGAGAAIWNDNRLRGREGKRKRYEERSNLRYASSRMGRALALEEMANRDDQAIEGNVINTEYEMGKLGMNDPMVSNDRAGRARAMAMKETEARLNLQKLHTDTYMEEIQSAAGRAQVFGESPTGSDLAAARRAENIGQMTHATTAMQSAQANATNIRRQEYSSAMQDAAKGERLRTMAAGIASEKGQGLAIARAVQETRADFGKTAGAYSEMMDHYKLSGEEIQALAMGEGSVTVLDAAGSPIMTFDHTEEHVRDAAVEMVMKTVGNYSAQRDIVYKSGTEEYADNRATISNNMGKLLERAGLSGAAMDAVRTGKVVGRDGYLQVIRDNIAGGKFKAANLAKMDPGGLKDWVEAVGKMEIDARHDDALAKRVASLRMEAAKALTNDNINFELVDDSKIHLATLAGEGALKVAREKAKSDD